MAHGTCARARARGHYVSPRRHGQLRRGLRSTMAERHAPPNAPTTTTYYARPPAHRRRRGATPPTRPATPPPTTHQSSIVLLKVLWNYLGVSEAQELLRWGSKRLILTNLDEKIIVMAGGLSLKMTRETMQQLIRDVGRIPARSTFWTTIK